MNRAPFAATIAEQTEQAGAYLDANQTSLVKMADGAIDALCDNTPYLTLDGQEVAEPDGISRLGYPTWATYLERIGSI